jgi:acyl-CoA thioesterase
MSGRLSSKRKQQILSEFPRFPFPNHLGLEIEELRYGYARLKQPFKTELTQGHDYLHGGVITALCDSAVAFALATIINKGEDMLTIELKVNFTAPADDDVFADAKIIHKGKNTAVGEADVYKKDGTLVAKGIVTYFLRT